MSMEGQILYEGLSIKERSPIFNFFSNFWRFCYCKKAHIFLITYVKFYSWKVFRLEDLNKNVSGNGNHTQAYRVR